MGVPVLSEEEVEKIGLFLKDRISGWIEEGNILSFPKDVYLAERIVRVEEGIKHQGDLMEKLMYQMDKRFEQVDKRLEQMQIEMDKRFEQVDKRFEAMQHQTDIRFDSVDKRFTQLQWTMGLGFTLMAALMGIFNFY